MIIETQGKAELDNPLSSAFVLRLLLSTDSADGARLSEKVFEIGLRDSEIAVSRFADSHIWQPSIIAHFVNACRADIQHSGDFAGFEHPVWHGFLSGLACHLVFSCGLKITAFGSVGTYTTYTTTQLR